MKKIIAILLVLVLAMSLAVPASAVTTMRWDWGAARKSIDSAIEDLIQEQQTEPTETEYTVVEETVATVSETETVEPTADITVDRTQSWRDWLRRWSWCMEGWK